MVSPLGKAGAICDALDEHASHRLMCLSTWSPVTVTVQEGLGGVACWRRCIIGVGFVVSEDFRGGGGHPQYVSLCLLLVG